MLSLVRPARRILQRTPLLRAMASSSEAKWSVTNDRIRSRVVNIAGDGGAMRQDVPIQEALEEARAQGVDLVQVSPVGKQPAICRMFDAKKRMYEIKKATKKASKQQKPKQDKEVVVGAKIAPNDLKFKVEQLKRFLAKGHKVKVTVQFNQAFHLKDQCLAQLKHIAELIDAETGVAMAEPRQQYGGVYVYFSPATAN